MSIEHMSAVWRDFTGNPTAKLVLLSLADQANNEGWSWPSHKHLAKRCMVSDRQVRTWLQRLVADGWIEIHKREGKSDMYRVKTDKSAAMERSTPEADFLPLRKPTSYPLGSPLPTNHKEPSRTPNTVSSTVKVPCPYCRRRFTWGTPHDCPSMNQRIR